MNLLVYISFDFSIIWYHVSKIFKQCELMILSPTFTYWIVKLFLLLIFLYTPFFFCLSENHVFLNFFFKSPISFKSFFDSLSRVIPSKKNMHLNQSLVGSVVIDVELDREDHSLIPDNCDREEVGTTWCQNWP